MSVNFAKKKKPVLYVCHPCFLWRVQMCVGITCECSCTCMYMCELLSGSQMSVSHVLIYHSPTFLFYQNISLSLVYLTGRQQTPGISLSVSNTVITRKCSHGQLVVQVLEMGHTPLCFQRNHPGHYLCVTSTSHASTSPSSYLYNFYLFSKAEVFF